MPICAAIDQWQSPEYALDLLYAASRNQELPASSPPPATPDIVNNAADYAGTFTAPDGRKLVLIAQGDKLILQHDGHRIVLEQSGRDRFIVKHPDYDLFTLNFGRDNDASWKHSTALTGGPTNATRDRRSLSIQRSGTLLPDATDPIVPGMEAPGCLFAKGG